MTNPLTPKPTPREELRMGLQIVFFPSPVPTIAQPEVDRALDKAMHLVDTYLQNTVEEIIGPSNVFVATDDLIADHNISFAIQERTKSCMREKAKRYFDGTI